MVKLVRYLFVNDKREIFDYCDEVKDMLQISFNLNNQKIKYAIYEISSKKTF